MRCAAGWTLLSVLLLLLPKHLVEEAMELGRHNQERMKAQK
jgi:hypothetical protein